MILKAIEMQGFKSFPEKTVLQFGKGITAVVGPNGSGKSNISDAVRWVLGEQSTKSLRGTKMEDVIFDGTKVRKAHGFAQVTLRLDNTDRSIPAVDEDEIAVTRRFFRSGESEYKINGNAVRLRDLHQLFMDTGLGRDGYSLVSQGKVNDMISGKGRECREMLEEACGISAYRYRRGDSLKKLAQAEENLLRLRDILSELEGRIGPLRTQSEKAEKFLVLAASRKEIEIGLWLYQIEKLKNDLRKQDDAISVANAHYEENARALEEIEEKIEAAFQSSQQITAQIDAIRQQISENEEQSSNAESQCAVLQNSIDHNEQTIARIEREKEASGQTKAQLETEISAEEGFLAQIKKIVAQKSEQLETVRGSLEETGSEGGSLDVKAKEIDQKLNEAARLAADARVAQWAAHSSQQEIEARLQTVAQALVERDSALSALQTNLKNAQNAQQACESELQTLNNQISGLQLKCANREEKADSLKKELDTQKFDLQHTRSKIRILEDLEQNMEGYAGSVKAVIQQSKAGKLAGIHATVAKLISMQNEHAVAIETALGNSVQHIVCETPSDAKAAIRYLQREHLGRATFQPIAAVKGKVLEETGLAEHPGFLGIASDLIVCEERYGEIMRSLLGRTVVSEDLDSAVSIAKAYQYKFKVVTLDGQVVNPGGSMTGGSQAKNAGLLTRSSEIERLREKVKRLETQCVSMQEDYNKAEAELFELQTQLDLLKEQSAQKVQDRIRCTGELQLAKEQFDSESSARQALAAEQDSANARLNAFRTEEQRAEEETLRLQQTSETLKKELSALGEQRETLNQRREEISQTISKLTLELHDANKDLAARTQAMNLLKAQLVNQEDKEKELDAEITQIASENKNLRSTISLLKQQAQTLRDRSALQKQTIIDLQTERAKAEESSTVLRGEEREKSALREQLGGEKARLEERKTTMQSEYDDTLSKLYDEYQLTLREAQNDYSKTDEPTAARKQLAEIRGKIRALGTVNLSAIEEYKEVNERYTFLSAQLSDVEASKAELNKLIAELTDKMAKRFREQFSKINQYFDETFRELFDGGKAELILEDPADVLESNIEIRLQPPGKNVKRMDALSGGEKGLSAISLLFAILKVNPAPFCIFDEVEAALDDANVGRYAQYVRRMTKNTQFILITHRRGTMEEADVLYGITMQEQGVSKLLELKTAEIANRLGITG